MQASVACTICSTITTTIAAEIKLSNITTHTAACIASVTCHLLAKTPTVTKTCDTIISSINKIVTYVSNGLTPHQTCEKIKLCE